jgi:hypothetical protein
MIHGKAEITKLETESFEFVERLDAGVNVDLFSKTVISVVGDKHHSHPVISGVTRNLFRATATYNIHRVFSLSHLFRAHPSGVPRATKNRYVLIGEKDGFSSAGLKTFCF